MSGACARVVAQAKINLFLRVLGREDSGYHQLETLFARLELGDVVTVRADARDRTLDCAGPALPAAGLGPVERNLAWRAAAAFAERAGWPRGFAIEIEKRIPVGGGLGGGSADAGAVLRALNALAPRPLPIDALLALAASLGADVPVLTAEEALVLAWGRGERMLALPPLPARDVLLLVPPFGVSTRDAFEWLAAERGMASRAPVPQLLTAAALEAWESVELLAGNDLEAPVIHRHPEIGHGIAGLRVMGARLARMSGSGSTVFGIFDRRPAPLASGAGRGWGLHATRTATRVVGVERME